MNSTIYVQQNIGIPAGPLTSEKTSTSASDQGKKKSVGAIIRPMPRETGKQGTVRLDQADEGAPSTHIRNHDLDAYVNWLRAKIKRDQEDVRKKPSVQVVKMKAAKSSASVPAPVSMPSQKVAEPSEQPGFSTKNFVRVDQPHMGVSEAYLKFDELRTQHEIEHAANVIAQTRGIESEAMEPAAAAKLARPVRDQSELIDRIAKAIASVLTETSDQVIEEKLGGVSIPNPTSPSEHNQILSQVQIGSDASEAPRQNASVEESRTSAINTDEIIAGEGIAGEDIAGEGIAGEDIAGEGIAGEDIAGEDIANIEVDKLDRATLAELVHAGGKPVSEMKSEAAKVTSEILNQSNKEIPTSVAAWDVEDFRWPVITNRMIVSGGEALDQLSRSVFDMVSPSNHRLAVTGVDRGEGTTSIAISLARWAAACGKQVLLVDADLATPSLTQQVGLAPNISWVNAVSQSLPSAEVIVRSQHSNLCVMPLAQMVSRVSWPRFIYDNLGEVIDQVQHHFDLVVLDMGPANQFMEELSRSSLLADATLMVHDGLNSPEFQKTKNRLTGFGLTRMIIAENRARLASVNVA